MLTDFTKIIDENAFSIKKTSDEYLGFFSAYFNPEDSRIVLKVDLPGGINYNNDEIDILIEDLKEFLNNL